MAVQLLRKSMWRGMVDPPVLDPIPTDTINCINTMVSISSSADAGGDPVSYSWAGPLGDIAGANTPMLDVTTPGTYVLTATNTSNSCASFTSVVIIEDMPNMTIDEIGDSTRTCAVTSIDFPEAIVNLSLIHI